MSNIKYKIGIVGGTSLLAGYLLKYLVNHAGVEISYIDSEHNPGEKLGNYHKHLNDPLSQRKLDKYSPDTIKNDLDLVFIAKPHTQAMNYVKELYNDQLKIIDLSGDFRIKDVKEYEKWYKADHNAKELIKESVYGLSEIYDKEIKETKLIANPGCFPTGIILSLYPLIKNECIDKKSIYITSYTGVSGAGKNPVPGKNLFLDIFNNIIPYRVLDHQHTPEIEEQINLNNEKEMINFIPHLTSMENGILNTIYLKLKKAMNQDEINSIYQNEYKNKKFMRITNDIPQIKDVVDTNDCIIYPQYNSRTGTLIIISVIDNRIKGGAGQAVQNMNLMLGFEEETSLKD